MTDARAAAKELLARRRALKDPRDFIRLLRREGLLDFDYEPDAHHELLADTFVRLDDPEEAIHRITVSLPPGSAKSFYCSVVLPCWLLAKNPKLKILCISNTETLAFEHSHRRRQIMMTDTWQRLANTALLSDAKSLGKQAVPEGGTIYAVGASGTCTGLRSDWTIVDDAITGHEQASNRAQLDKLWQWWISEARVRGRPGCRELFVGTRWHVADPIGRAMKLSEQGKENWEHIRIPMECDSDDDPLNRKIGERLAPHYFKASMIRTLKQEPLWWQTQQQQRPAVEEGAWVPPEHVHVMSRDHFPEHMTHYIGCDIALSVGAGDFTVLAVIGIDMHNHFHLVDMYRKQVDTSEAAKALARLCSQYHPKTCFVDNDNASKVWKELVAMEASRLGVRVPLRLTKMRNRDKPTRAAPLRSLFMQNRFTIADTDWTHLVTNEISGFQAGATTDDAIDAIGLVPMQMRRIIAPKVPQQQRPPKPIEGAFQQMPDGSVKTRETFDQLIDSNRHETLRAGGRMRI